MSILLESLNQSKNSDNSSSNNIVPRVEDSHFDDEILSDEWILKKLFAWKIISGLLFAVLLASWTMFYFYPNKSVDQLQENAPNSEPQTFPATSKNQPVVTTDIEEKSELISKSKSIEESLAKREKITSKNVNDIEQPAENIKQKYQPKKLKSSTDVNQINKKQAKVTTTQATAPQKETGQAVEFESLSEFEKQQLPELEISSYAVSSNADKSFVVLNGAFYGQGETIAPHLVLILIDKEGILIRYKGKLISKKYSL